MNEYKSLIEQLFYDNENLSGKTELNEKYKHLNDSERKLLEKLLSGLTPEQENLLSDLLEVRCNLEAEAAFLHFKTGFKAGMRLAHESF